MSNVTNLSTSTKPAPTAWVESLFARMEAMYGSKFLDMWRGADIGLVKTMWGDEMGKLSGEELKRGYSALMAQDWPPSLPAFVKLCRPPIDPMKAYYEAVAGTQARSNGEAGTWSHPAIYWAAMPLSFDLGTQTYSQIKARWERALEEQMGRGEWEPIPAPMVALPAPGKSPLSKEKAAQMLNELGAGSVLKPKEDHKAWAKKILERAKLKNHGLNALQIRFAKEALGVTE